LADRRTLETWLEGTAAAPDFSQVRKPQGVRARGELRLAFTRRAGRTRLTEAYQAGCLRARTPQAHENTRAELVLINTGGGVTGGDHLIQSVRWEAGAVATVATQAAEKVYRAAQDEVVIETRLEVAAGADAEWLPQETILFSGARLARDTRIDLAPGARFLGVEAIILGRTAMGETVHEGRLRDRWRITRAGRLVYADALRLEGRIDALMQRAALGAGAKAMAVAVLAVEGAADFLPAVRTAMETAQGRAGASVVNGLLVARLLAPDGQTLRHDLTRVLTALRDGRALPRVWTC
jgi:urease accessory protein